MLRRCDQDSPGVSEPPPPWILLGRLADTGVLALLRRLRLLGLGLLFALRAREVGTDADAGIGVSSPPVEGNCRKMCTGMECSRGGLEGSFSTKGRGPSVAR